MLMLWLCVIVCVCVCTMLHHQQSLSWRCEASGVKGCCVLTAAKQVARAVALCCNVMCCAHQGWALLPRAAGPPPCCASASTHQTASTARQAGRETEDQSDLRVAQSPHVTASKHTFTRELGSMHTAHLVPASTTGTAAEALSIEVSTHNRTLDL